MIITQNAIQIQQSQTNCVIRFVIFYYGQWPIFIEPWARSVGNNLGIEVIIITDLKPLDFFPSNIKIHTSTYEEVMQKMEKILNLKLPRYQYHKLCDYKPLVALAYPFLVSDAPYWGYCDVDLIFGDLTPLVEMAKSGKYDVITPFTYTVGHCTIVKNTPSNNSISLSSKNIEARLNMSDISFMDEGGFSEAALACGVKIFALPSNESELEKTKCFIGATFSGGGRVAGSQMHDWIAYWRDGKTYLCNKSGEREVLYLHFMSFKQMRFWNELIPFKANDYTFTPYAFKAGIDPRLTLKSLGYVIRASISKARYSLYSTMRSLLPLALLHKLKKMPRVRNFFRTLK